MSRRNWGRNRSNGLLAKLPKSLCWACCFTLTEQTHKYTMSGLRSSMRSYMHKQTRLQNPHVQVSGEGGSGGLADRQESLRGHGDLQTGCPLEHTSLCLWLFNTKPAPYKLLFHSLHVFHLLSTNAHIIWQGKYRGRFKQGGKKSESVITVLSSQKVLTFTDHFLYNYKISVCHNMLLPLKLCCFLWGYKQETV